LVLTHYNALGGNDKIAKGPELKENLLSELAKQFSDGEVGIAVEGS